jgi:hypothetical protein
MGGVLCVLAEVDSHPFDLPVELRPGGYVIVADRRASVAADIGLVVQREQVRRALLEHNGFERVATRVDPEDGEEVFLWRKRL